MARIRRILCPVDFSECSRHALDEAIGIARLYDASVTVLHVFPEAIPADPFAGLPEFQPFRLTDAHRKHLFDHMKAFAASEGADAHRVEFALREGTDIDAEILVSATQIEPDLIVIGTHGRSGFQHLMLGSVAEKVLHKARCPVLTVPRKAPEAMPLGPVPFVRILCAVDFSDCSLAALRYAASFAAQSQARLDVVSVVQLIPMYETTGAVPLYYPGLLNDLKGEIEKQLESVVTAATCGADARRFVTTGTPHREIVRMAAELRAELIVVGAHSHAPVERLLFGSTTNHVIRRAACPVLTVRK